MFSITNDKVAGFTPRWQTFRGFSILFDNPGDCLTASGLCLHLVGDVDTDGALGFYKALRDSLACLDPDLLTATYLFCPLPPPSYHVTVWDGANDGNASFVVSDKRPALERLLAGLPDTLALPQEITAPAFHSPLVRRRDWDIEFRFDRLAIRGALVARLSPTQASEEAFAAFVDERHRLNDFIHETFGIAAYDDYTPHVSLGYFGSREGAQSARPCLRDWNALFAERMEGRTITFSQASLYGFTDMATFFRTAAPPRV